MVFLEFIEMFLWPLYRTFFNVAVFVNVYSRFICTCFSLYSSSPSLLIWIFKLFSQLLFFFNFQFIDFFSPNYKIKFIEKVPEAEVNTEEMDSGNELEGEILALKDERGRKREREDS